MPKQRTGHREVFRKTLVSRARELRGHMTVPEVRLWTYLKNDQLGVRFRRQHRIGSYIADFFCHAARLVVEIDGDSHDERAEYDAKRTFWMSEHGLRVIRFTNEDVLKFTDGVVQAIADCCSSAACPSPQPSPLSTGERE